MNVLRQFILEDNIEPMNTHTVRIYMEDLIHLISMLKDQAIHSYLKRLCENIFEEMYEKLAKEKDLIDSGHTTHNEIDTANINRQLNGLNSIYTEFRIIINNY